MQKTCETCIKFRKSVPQPIVAFANAEGFNQTVPVDLHELKPNLWYIHIIYEFTRYYKAVIITSKSMSTKAYLKNWIVILCAPKKTFTDNGEEFIGDAFREMSERIDIKVQTTSSYSPWRNALREKDSET